MKLQNFPGEAEHWLREEYLFLTSNYVFARPREILTAYTPLQVEKIFAQIERYSRKYYCAGFLSYELGYVLEDCFAYRRRSFPLICFGIFEKPFAVRSNILAARKLGEVHLSNLRLNLSRGAYRKKVARIKHSIEQGDIYQANLTIKYRFDVHGSPLALYRLLLRHQPVPHCAFLKIKDRYILSLSPELFFRRQGNTMLCKPMKGTLGRGRTRAEDCTRKAALKQDRKNRAENVMIVDLLRNDLSKISQAYSVRVKKLFQVEPYPTLFQMVSVIRGTLSSGVSYGDIFRALFPCGSIVGAPKIRAMQILKQIEEEERKIYCGSIGYIAPGGKAVFNVAIRTLLIEQGQGELGVGGGIVWDSDAEEEFEECRLKALFLRKAAGEK